MLLQIIVSFTAAAFLGLFLGLYTLLVATPRRLRRLLKQQGFGGPPPSNFLLGNILEIKQLSTAPPPSDHNLGPYLYPVFRKWRQQHGDIYTFTLGTKPVLVVYNYDVIKELITCTSLDLGRPSYLAKDLKALLGNGVSSANGNLWVYERKIIAPTLFLHKIKGMTSSIERSTLMLIDSWRAEIDSQGGKADIKVDHDLKKFAGDVVARVCFGSNYSESEEIFLKLQALELVVAKKGFFLGVPGIRYVPTKNNRRERELERDVKDLILKLIKEKHGPGSEENMLKTILEGAESSNIRPSEMEDFIIDNCKSIFMAAFEPTSIAISWCLMLLASNQEWQQRVREEVIRVCRGQFPDSESLRQMKQLTMVILESLRLYSTGHITSRGVLNDLEFANVRIPKGVIIWIMTTSLNTDPEIWGPDSYEFKPERFANGTSGACKLPHLFSPFGFGPRICLGQTLAMVEIKMLLAHILCNFSFSLSPKYVHAPTIRGHLKPGNGVDLVIEKLKNAPCF